MADPLVDLFMGGKPKLVPATARPPAIVPGMTADEEYRCLDEIRAMGSQAASWKLLHNGQTAGEFSWLYVYHFRLRRNDRSICGGGGSVVITNHT